MNMTSFKNHFHHLSALLEEGTETINWKQDWRLILIFLAITVLTGPLAMLGVGIQRWNSTPSWDTEDHWNATKQAALTFAGLDLLLVVAFLYFHPFLTAFWYLILWYWICTLLAPTFALVAERIDPRTDVLQRVQLPSEQPPPPAPAAPPPPSVQQVTIEEREPAPPGQPTQNKRSTKKKTATPTTPLTSKQELDKKLTKKMNKGRAVPMIDLLQQEKEERERKRTQINYVQAPLLPTEAESAHPSNVPKKEESLASNGNVSTSAPSTTPMPESSPSQKKPERRQPESLDKLF
jgi:outer membrane biosynthesis protein TonB